MQIQCQPDAKKTGFHLLRRRLFSRFRMQRYGRILIAERKTRNNSQTTMDKLPQNGQIGENAKKIVASTPIFVKKLLFSCWIWLFRLMCFEPVVAPAGIGNQRNTQRKCALHLFHHQPFHALFLFGNDREVQFIVHLQYHLAL